MLKIGLTGGIGSGKSTITHYFAALGAPIIDADVIVHKLFEQNEEVRSKIFKHFGKQAFKLNKNTVHANKISETEQIDSSSLNLDKARSQRAPGMYKDIHEESTQEQQRRHKIGRIADFELRSVSDSSPNGESQDGSSINSKCEGSIDRGYLRKIIFANKNERKWLEQLMHPLVYQEIKRQLHTIKAQYCIIVIPLLLETGGQKIIDRILLVNTDIEERIKRTMQRDNIDAKAVSAIIKSQADSKQLLFFANDIIDNNGSLENTKKQVLKLHELYIKLCNKA